MPSGATAARGSLRPYDVGSFTVVNRGVDDATATAGSVATATPHTENAARTNETFRADMTRPYGRAGVAHNGGGRRRGQSEVKRNGFGGGLSSARGQSARVRPPNCSASSHSDATVHPCSVPKPVTVARKTVIS